MWHQEQLKEEYDDGSILNEEYRKYVSRYDNQVVPVVTELFNNIAAQNCTLKNIDYNILEYQKSTDGIFTMYEPSCDLEHCDLKQRVREVLVCYAQEVIDFKILHALAEHAKQGVEIGVVYTGSYHINAIKRALKKLGYEFSKYPTITYAEDGNIQPLNVARAFQEMDSTYDPNQELPKETIDYFFKYKEAEENNPCFATRSAMKLFVTAADALCRYKSWKQEYPRLDNVFKAALSVGAASAVIWVLKVCCRPK